MRRVEPNEDGAITINGVPQSGDRTVGDIEDFDVERIGALGELVDVGGGSFVRRLRCGVVRNARLRSAGSGKQARGDERNAEQASRGRERFHPSANPATWCRIPAGDIF